MEVVTHNLLSQFTSKQLKITGKEKEKSTEKLSSGYRINRAGDDAAGLSISEKMRWQIRGLNRASDNIQDGISLIQVADGALNETHAVLQRMRELSVQAANDTNTDDDRAAIQKEMDAMIKEVDRIANETSFNESIYPLTGKYNGTISMYGTAADINLYSPTPIADAESIQTTGTINDLDWAVTWYLDDSFCHNRFSQLEWSFYNSTNHDTFNPASLIEYIFDKGLNVNPGDTVKVYSEFQNRVLWGNSQIYSLYAKNETTNSQVLLDDNLQILMPSKADGIANWLYFRHGVASNNDMLSIYGRLRNDYPESSFSLEPIFDNTDNFFIKFKFPGSSESTTDTGIWIQMGTKENQGMFLSLVNATAKGLGLTNPPLDVSDFSAADLSLSQIDKAIEKVSSYRSYFGAAQNRLESAKKVDDNTSENTQAAESKLRDTDMTKEITHLSKHNILEQAGQSMLAQTNRNPQNILNLLQ